MDLSSIKGAFFDLDGVVFDTEPQYTEFWGSQCRLYHPEQIGLENDIKGTTLTQIFDKYFSGPLEKERDAVNERLRAFEQAMHFDYVDGFQSFVELLRQRGIKTAVVTSSNVPKMESVYRQRPEFKALFDRVFTSEDFARSKPFPDCYLTAASHFGLAPAECLVFEDSFNGLKSGRAAGMHVIGLATTYDAATIAPLCDEVISNYESINV